MDFTISFKETISIFNFSSLLFTVGNSLIIRSFPLSYFSFYKSFNFNSSYLIWILVISSWPSRWDYLKDELDLDSTLIFWFLVPSCKVCYSSVTSRLFLYSSIACIESHTSAIFCSCSELRESDSWISFCNRAHSCWACWQTAWA